MKSTRVLPNAVFELSTRLRTSRGEFDAFFVVDPDGVIINVSSHLQR
jgi:hypothetical protein